MNPLLRNLALVSQLVQLSVPVPAHLVLSSGPLLSEHVRCWESVKDFPSIDRCEPLRAPD